MCTSTSSSSSVEHEELMGGGSKFRNSFWASDDKLSGNSMFSIRNKLPRTIGFLNVGMPSFATAFIMRNELEAVGSDRTYMLQPGRGALATRTCCLVPLLKEVQPPLSSTTKATTPRPFN